VSKPEKGDEAKPDNAESRPLSKFIRTLVDAIEKSRLPLDGALGELPAREDKASRLQAAAFADLTARERPSTDAVVQMVQRVGQRLAATVPDRQIRCEFKLFVSPAVNAFCMAGGKVAVFTGILRVCRNEAGVAAVLGHLIAHTIERPGENGPQAVVPSDIQRRIVDELQSRGIDDSKVNVAATDFGTAAALGIVCPYGREQELEADIVGTELMARAGYDPREAPAVWKRMVAVADDRGGAGFLAAHPRSSEQAKQFADIMSRLMTLYEASPRFGLGEPVPDRFLGRSARTRWKNIGEIWNGFKILPVVVFLLLLDSCCFTGGGNLVKDLMQAFLGYLWRRWFGGD